MKAIRILVVDDESVVRDGVVTILSFQPDMKVVGEAENGIKAVEIARQAKPDVILLDLMMPKQSGLESIPKIKHVSPDSRILVLTSFDESDLVYQSIKAGALGFLLKDATRVQLLQAIRDVAKGQASIQPSIAMKVINEIDHPAELIYTANPLTPRELETLKFIARGLSNQEIANSLVVHERTVAKYVSSILNKLHLANRTQAALYAINEGLAESKK
ncbi:response regulator transcription factor [Candidatus Villigracilis saccharophilus]|uniref:response regulator transcription factor n=1 Tax=Candidatus Villigracilis saccharophilus TaxID=3140684 RepID=UPI00313761CE|nr:response regulator transcription factor [Anaerolineales bacterium]